MTITEKTICKLTPLMAGLYIHVPFCTQACYYCDFHFSTDTRSRGELCHALVHELVLQKEYLDEPLQTIYLGGGTPSLLSEAELALLLGSIHTHYAVAPDAEITLEANPDDLSKQKLKELYGAGVNRLSIGVQSFDDILLKFLHRSHNARASRQSLEDAQAAGFTNFSIDLIYAIPGLSEKAWIETLQEAIRFAPAHISSYALTIEDKTVFGHMTKRGKLTPMEEEKTAKQFELLMDVLNVSGYEHYEISNFCKPGKYSRHNSSYWNQSMYLGIGPSAHSYNDHSRQFNIRNNALYVRSIEKGIVPYEREILTRENKINEYILTTLRTQWGCDLNFLKQQFNEDLLQKHGGYVSQLQLQSLVLIQNGIMRLTRKGKLLADKIAEDLMASA